MFQVTKASPIRAALALAAAALFALAALAGCGEETSNDQPAVEPVVQKVDHVTVSCSDPQGLFDTFTQTLGLPAAWPFSAYPGFSTGGVYMGNVNLETLKFEGGAGQQMPPFTFIYGIVFEPYPLDQVTSELEARGADPSPPQDQMRDFNGQQVKVWTNVTLQALCTDSYIVYLCEYTPQAKAALTANTGSTDPLGGIGLTGVKEIDIVSTTPDQTRDLWETVFAPAPMSVDGLLSFDSGPSIRIAAGNEDLIEKLVLQVASLQEARDFLEGAGLLGEASGKELTINPDAVQGLDIRLVEE